MGIVTHYEPHVAVLLLGLAMLVAWGVAWRLGARLRGRPGRRAESKFDDASLALLGLLLAFTFGMSLNKHDHRRDMVVTDANSIGDFYTCASLLKEPTRGKLLRVIREYAELRLEVADSKHPEAELQVALPRFRTMQVEMAQLVAEAMEERAPDAGPLVSSFNRLRNAHAARLAAVKDRLPPEIVVLLFVSAIIATVLVGREQGAAGTPEIAGTLAFIVLVVLTISVTLDLNQPTSGFVKVSQEPVRELIATLPK